MATGNPAEPANPALHRTRPRRSFRGALMELDTNKIDEAVLALLYLGLHDGVRVWKSFDWEAMNRLHEKGFITDPRSKAMSVLFTAEGRARAEELLVKLFGQQPEPGIGPDSAA
jgi:hypothetical protein